MKGSISSTSSSSATEILLFFLLITVALPQLARAQQPSDGSKSDDDPWDRSNNVSPSMAILVIVLVACFFITGCISIYIQQCSDNSVTQTLPVTTRANATHGLDKTIIETFPTFAYSAVKELKIGKGALECAVCLNEFEEDETLRLIPKCDHVFHPECIDAWLIGHTTCPVCRANLVPDLDHLDKSVHDTHPVDHPLESESNPSRHDVQITIREGEEVTNNRHISTELTTKRKVIMPRSHSTGHSLIQPGENCDKFTLKLPPEVRRQLLARTKLKRATSLVALPRQTSSRRGYRGEGSGSSRYGRLFGRSFRSFSRLGSFRSTAKVGADGDVSVGSSSSKRCSTTVVTPLESLPQLPV